VATPDSCRDSSNGDSCTSAKSRPTFRASRRVRSTSPRSGLFAARQVDNAGKFSQPFKGRP
jgi:hypothetical protein